MREADNTADRQPGVAVLGQDHGNGGDDAIALMTLDGLGRKVVSTARQGRAELETVRIWRIGLFADHVSVAARIHPGRRPYLSGVQGVRETAPHEYAELSRFDVSSLIMRRISP